MDPDVDEDYVKRVVKTFQNYQTDMMNRQSYAQKMFTESSLSHKEILLQTGFGRYLENLFNCVEANHNVLREIITSALNPDEIDLGADGSEAAKTLQIDHDRLNDCLLQIVNEWTEAGTDYRDQAFAPVLDRLKELFPSDCDRSEVSVLVPGAGLARLPFEIAQLGFNAIGNERDLFLLFTASFIMNNCERPNNYRIYPYIHDLKNRATMEAVTTPIGFPDIDVSDRSENFQFNMVPGDFASSAEANFEAECLDAVVTTFFLDSARNLIDYIGIIFKLLKPGGVWINLGGLNYSHSEDSISLPLDVVKEVIKSLGFEFVQDEMIKCSHGQRNYSMLNVTMECCFFTCKKS